MRPSLIQPCCWSHFPPDGADKSMERQWRGAFSRFCKNIEGAAFNNHKNRPSYLKKLLFNCLGLCPCPCQMHRRPNLWSTGCRQGYPINVNNSGIFKLVHRVRKFFCAFSPHLKQIDLLLACKELFKSNRYQLTYFQWIITWIK